MINSINDFYIDNFLSDFFTSLEKPSGTILDLGCGMQPYRKYYESRFSKIITADVENRSGKTDVMLTSEILPFENEQFDLVLFTEVIEHIPDPFTAIREVSRILKPGGTLLITWPFNYPMHEIPNDHFRYTEFQMERLLKNNEINIIRLKRRGNSWSILHTIGFQYGLNISEFLIRIPIVGKIFIPVSWLIKKLLEFSNKIHYLIVKDFKSLNPDKTGDGLKGVMGSFAQWTLGYCVIAKKI
ncbi:MAG: class I SAM-dependent methyltransferase [Ignavibacteriales bacterium]|nr:MAG: class I SAM-dependent methyltransferase [Ignavibacteriales bacterium]